MIEALQGINNTLTNFLGNTTLLAVMIIMFFIIGFMMAGLDFKIAILMTFPLVAWYGSKTIALLPPAVNAVFWIIIIGLGIFVLWNIIQERIYA